MSAAYFIVLDNGDPGFDNFVNGKFVAREGRRLDRLTRSLGLRGINDFVSADPEELMEMAADCGVDEPFEAPPEEWFDPDEGLSWTAQVRAHIESHPDSVRDAEGVLSDLAEYQSVLEQAKSINARWHFALDY